jgi:hypothetical protein
VGVKRQKQGGMSTIVCSRLEGLDLAGKIGDPRVQRRERGEVDECADDMGPSLICTASHGPLGRSREIHFGLTESRSQNRSPVENEGWGGEVNEESETERLEGGRAEKVKAARGT